MAVALSGGGDSLALLHIAADWAKGAGRRFVAITVDHGLNPVSREWSRRCALAARAVGAEWTERRWTGDKPTTGLPAAARRARHALIAEAAREAGARVVLFAHTLDDIAEADWMREHGSTLGRLREWSPSPAWPAGRDLMLLRPMLGERREDLRTFLRARNETWIEDPANARFQRGQARKTLSPISAGEDPSFANRGKTSTEKTKTAAPAPAPSLLLGEGFEISRIVDATTLAAVILCAAGCDVPPRGERLTTLLSRIRSGEPFAATLAGARIDASADRVLITREPGEFRRRPLPPFPLVAGRPVVWDGRYQITAPDTGWTVTAALGRLAALSAADRAVADTVSPAARGALPVLFRDGSDAPVLAWRVAEVLSLAPRRLSLALGETTQERDLGRTIHGETPPPDLF